MTTPARPVPPRAKKRRISDVSSPSEQPSSRIRLSTTEDEDNTVEEDVDVVVNMPEDKRAPVWRYFSKTEEDKNKAECSLCQTKVSINNSSTSMMKLHIERNHQKVYKNELAGLIKARRDEFKLKKAKKQQLEAEKDRVQPKIKNFAAPEPYGNNHTRTQKLDESVAKYFVRTNTAFNKVEHPAFREFLYDVDPRYTAPSINKVIRDIDKMREDVEATMKDDLQKVFQTNNSVSFVFYIRWRYWRRQ